MQFNYKLIFYIFLFHIIDTYTVFINGQNETKTSKQVKLGDIITIRGKGRYIVKEFSGTTRSGRTVVKVEKYV